MLVKKTSRSPQRGFVEMIAQVGDGAEAGIIHQVGTRVVAQSLEYGCYDQREGHYVPGVMDMHEMGKQQPQVEVPLTPGETQQDGAFRRIRPENLVEDGLKEENAEGVKRAHQGQQQHSRQPLEPVGKPIA